MAARKEPESVTVGDVYKNKDSGLEVTAFHYDFGTNLVHYNHLGRADVNFMKQGEFLAAFEHVGPVSAVLGEKTPAKER